MFLPGCTLRIILARGSQSLTPRGQTKTLEFSSETEVVVEVVQTTKYNVVVRARFSIDLDVRSDDTTFIDYTYSTDYCKSKY